MKTRGITFLESQKIPFTILTYEHKVKGAEYAAYMLNVPVEQMIKTIVVKDEKSKFYFCLMPGDLDFSLKKVARLLNVKTIALAKEDEAERATGYLVGGISPFGSKKYLPVLLNLSLTAFDEIYINAGARGMILKLKLQNLINLLKPIIDDFA